MDVNITPDGSRIVAASGDNNVYLLDGQGNSLWFFETGGEALGAAVTPDGSRVAVGSGDNNIYLLDGQNP